MADDKTLLVLTCARSGSKFMARFLNPLGIEVGHEKMGPDGAVGYPCVSWISPRQPRFRGMNMGQIWHQVRHPLAVIASLVSYGPIPQTPHWKLTGTYLPLPNELLPRCMAVWYRWNLRCLAVAEWSYRVESVYNGSRTYREMLRRLRLPLDTPLPKIARNVNTRPHLPLTWAELKDADAGLASGIRWLARRYGYGA